MKVVIKGILCGFVLISAFFWSSIPLVLLNGAAMVFFSLTVPLIINSALCALMFKNNKKSIIAECLISVLTAIPIFLFYREVGFVDLCLNKLYPEYGGLPADAGFGMLVYLCYFALCYAAAVLAALFLSYSGRENRI